MGWTGRPHRNWSGTSDSNRDSLGPRPSGLIRFPSPRNTKQQSVGLEPNERSSVRNHAHDECTLWGDRRESNPRGQIHSLPPKATRPRPRLVPGARVERACPAFQTGALTATASLANLVEEEGIEPSFAGCRPAVLPLNDSPNLVAGWRVERHSRGL